MSKTNRNNLEAALRQLENLKPVGDGFMASCPAHEDNNPSLSLTITEDGRLLFHCHAGCDPGEVRDCLEDLDLSDYLAGKGDPVAIYQYRTADGKLEFEVLRFQPKDFRQRRPGGSEGYVWSTKGCGKLPYRLPELLSSSGPILILEGEKDVDSAWALGFPATCNAGGAGKWTDEHTAYLPKGRVVVVVPDPDLPGDAHVMKVGASCLQAGLKVRMLELGADLSDWLRDGGKAEGLAELIEAAPEYSPEVGAAAASTEKPKSESMSAKLVRLAKEVVMDLFHDERDQPFVAIPDGDGNRVLPLEGAEFGRYLRKLLWSSEGSVANAGAVDEAIGVLAGAALFEGKRRQLSVRVARRGANFWYDLGAGRAVEITKDGAEVRSVPEATFRRFSHQADQVEPASLGDLELLRPYLRLKTDADWLLFKGYMIAALDPQIPHPVLCLAGDQGAAKTTVMRMLKRILDPSTVPLLSPPTSYEEFIQAASHHWCVFLDNLSSVPGWLSDTLCRIVTGEGFQKRRLYTDDEDLVYQIRRCLGVNGIAQVVSRSDLLDRCLIFDLERIPESERRTEKDLWRAFDDDLSKILAGLFELMSRTMSSYGDASRQNLQRMSDFQVWGRAMAIAEGLDPGTFDDALRANVNRQNDDAIEASMVAQAILLLLKRDGDEWNGAPTLLLGELRRVIEHEQLEPGRGFPTAANWLWQRIVQVRPNLAALGVYVDRGKDKFGNRVIRIKKEEARKPADHADRAVRKRRRVA